MTGVGPRAVIASLGLLDRQLRLFRAYVDNSKKIVRSFVRRVNIRRPHCGGRFAALRFLLWTPDAELDNCSGSRCCKSGSLGLNLACS